jgi:uncharacterized membrane protein YdjX (TVP38/TMEM64 family)
VRNPLIFLKKRGPLFWILAVQLIGFSVLTIALDFKAESITSWFAAFSQSPFALPATVLIYVLAAFVNAPQWMLHSGVVLVFTPLWGGVIAWVATLISASFDFWLGRRLGARRIHKMSGGYLAKSLRVIKNHGFLSSLIVRIVPTGPFVSVNLGAGVTRMRFSSFILGTAIGIIPKIALIVTISQGVKGSVEGKGPLYIAIITSIALAWLLIIYIAGTNLKKKRALRRKQEQNANQEQNDKNDDIKLQN